MAVLFAAFTGCSKEPPPPPSPAPALAASLAAAQALLSAVLPVASVPGPAPEAVPGAGATQESAGAGAASGAVPSSAAPSSAAPHEAAGPKTFACGAKGQPPCPTQAWMKANMAPAAASGDAGDLTKALEYVAARAPAGMANWASIARSGAAKAKAGDIDGAKGACKACHDQYKAKYKAEVRDRPF